MNENNKDFTQKAYEFMTDRNSRSRVSDDHSRATFFINDESLEQIEHLCAYIEVLGSVDGNLASERVEDHDNRNKYRRLSKGFKSTVVNMALDNLLENFIESHGSLPITEKVRFKSSDGLYHRAFKIVDGKNVYFSELDNRGNEILYFSNTVSTELFATSEEIEELFNKRLKQSGIVVDEVVEDVPTKRSILDELED
ncbi:hypothetical protein BUY79_12595 [Staphylococcus equorum]|uniref:hypothetical protein n=1 Tax=Staphylococcus equorum TaxID=246432 RepID=UPI000D1D0841|nr:hypothetical protein [Staphylococcus equorum]PTE82520.1 hypothetical protein BUY79_12595 [Staphylococcus equorum]